MKYEYEIPCCTKRLKDIRNFVNKVLKKHQIGDIQANKLVLAVDEVCANLIIHGKKSSVKDLIKLHISVEKDKGITFDIISDTGKGFNVQNFKEPSLQSLIKNKKKGGLGLKLVRRIMDYIEFKGNAHQNTYRLFVRI